LSDHDQLSAQVRDMLEHLYDYAHLQGHELSVSLSLGMGLSPREQMRALRNAVIRGIDQMDPGPGVELRAARARSYSVLNLHYVEGMGVDEVADELAISSRQVYRDLRRAESDLARVLLREAMERTQRQNARASAAGTESLVLREAARAGQGRRGHIFSGQRKGKGASLSQRALDPDVATVQLNKAAADGQSKPRAAGRSRAGHVDLVELFKDRTHLVHRNAGARVGDANYYVLFPFDDRDRDRALLCEAHGVVEQVEQHLTNASGVDGEL